MSEFFDEQEAAVLSELKIDLPNLFNLQFWINRFIDKLIGAIRRTIETGLTAGNLRIGEPLTAEEIANIPVEYAVIARQVSRSELVNTETSNQVTSLVISMLEENATLDEIKREMRKLFAGYRRFRVDRIARTVVVGAFEAGTLESWRAAGIDKKGWLSTQDGRVRPTHDEAGNLEPIPLNDPFIVGGAQLMHPGDPDGPAKEVINCFVGDTNVYSPNIERAYRGVYSGEVVTIETESGNKVTGTPNHPILTSRGWVALGSLNEFDSVIGCHNAEWSSLGNVDIKHVPTAIKQVFDTFEAFGGIVRDAGADVDFYGDRMNGNVDVVDIPRILQDRLKPSIFEPLGKASLSFADFASRFEFTDSLLNTGLMMEFGRLFSDSSVSSSDKLLSFFEWCVGHADVHGFATVADINTAFVQPAVNDLPANTKTFSKEFNRLASLVSSNQGSGVDNVPPTDNHLNTPFVEPADNGFDIASVGLGNALGAFPVQVTTDNIVNVSVRNGFSGHVYTFQTFEGIYLAEGIVSRNCRCTMIPVIEDE